MFFGGFFSNARRTCRQIPPEVNGVWMVCFGCPIAEPQEVALDV